MARVEHGLGAAIHHQVEPQTHGGLDGGGWWRVVVGGGRWWRGGGGQQSGNSKSNDACHHYRSLGTTNTNLERKTKEVMPLGLAQQGSRLYLVCRFHGHTNERSLALHRIQKASISTFDFAYPNNFNLEQYDLDGRFYFGEGEEIVLSFCIRQESGYHLLETPLSTKQSVKLIDGGYQFTATVIDSLQLDRWLLGFGSDVWNITKEAAGSPELS